jgi:hypothetical protein
MWWVARFPYSRFCDIKAPATATCALIKASGKSHFYNDDLCGNYSNIS